MKRPNLFIVGAPKCGTTALSEYLTTHPKVFFSNPKEPHYFSTDLSPKYRRYYTETQYLNTCFRGSNETHLVVGEGSTTYLHSSAALANISRFEPNAKIIVMLRNPIDMVYSWHSQLVYGCREDVLDFEEAWYLQESRRNGENIPVGCADPKLLQYEHVCSLGSHMERVYESFPDGQVLPILFDEFISNTAEIYKKVLDFLGLPDDGRVVFPKVNSNKAHRCYSVINFYNSTSKRLDVPKNRLKTILRVTNLGVRNFLFSKSEKKVKRKPMSREMKATLVEAFYDEITRLEILLNKDLKDWTRLD